METSLEASNPAHVEFHSKYGGMWVDRSDFDSILKNKLKSQELSAAEAQLVSEFRANGYVILKAAVSPQVIREMNEYIEQLWKSGRRDIKLDIHGKYFPLRSENRDKPTKILDLYWHAECFRQALFSEKIIRFMQIIFDEKPLLFQSLSFEKGTQQAIHQDTAYVVVDRPMQLAACWIALQDVKPNTGELQYYPGSHRLPDFDFGGAKKHWNSDLDGNEIHDRFLAELHEKARERGLNLEKFNPSAGDVLIWHADLAHGGSPVKDKVATRKSLVGHYCPQSAKPNYFKTLTPQIRSYGQGSYCTMYYNEDSADHRPNLLQRVRFALNRFWV